MKKRIKTLFFYLCLLYNYYVLESRNSMKNIKYLLQVCLVLCLIITVGCKKKVTTYIEITYDEFKQMIENKESFPLFVGSNQCSHCDDYKITLNEFIKDYHVKVYYIDIAKMEKEQYNEFVTYVNFGGSTPTTVFITDGVEKTTYNRIVGALSYSKIESKFEKAGYIKVK